MKNLQLSLILFFTLAQVICFGQTSQIQNIAITKPKVKATQSYTKGSTYLEYVMQDIISETAGLVNFVDKKSLKYITELRGKGYQEMESNIGSTEMEGVEFIIETKLLNYRESWKSYCHVVKEQYVKKDNSVGVREVSKDCEHSSILLNFDLQLDLISVETGEVVTKREISPSAWAYGEYVKEPTQEDKMTLRIKAYEDMTECFSMLWKNNILKLLNPEIEILSTREISNQKAQKVYIAGGINAFYPTNVKMDVVKKYDEEVAGEKIERSEKIGELSIESNYHQYSICKVKKGKKEIYAALDAGHTVVCTPGEMRKYESCGTQPERAKMIAEIKSTTTTIPLSDEDKKAIQSSTAAKTGSSTSKPKTTSKSSSNTATPKAKPSSARGKGGNQASPRSSSSNNSGKTKTTNKNSTKKPASETPAKKKKGGGQ